MNESINNTCRIIKHPAHLQSKTDSEKGNVDLVAPINFDAEKIDGSNASGPSFKSSHAVIEDQCPPSPKSRNRKNKAAWTEEHKAFLNLASKATPRLLIMRELDLTDAAFNRHYLEALRKGEISPIPDGTVFKPSAFPKEIRAGLKCGGSDLISIENAEDHLILRKI